jgi:ABC-2 type transport system ATP-binding protein
VAELVSVHKRLGTAQALAGVDLRLRRGEILGLLGPNGAGKTTALAVLLGLRRPDAGIVRLFGAPPTSRAARSRIGVCPQDVAFPPTLTVEEVARLTAAHFAAPADVRELLARFDLAHLRRRQCGGLSGGQRRLLAVALAFAGAPQAVFLDEPTTGLDVEARRSVWSEIRRFAEAGGTVLLTTHYLEEAEALAGRVAVLNGGVVVEEGPIGEVKARAGKRRVRLAAAPAASLLADVEIVPTDVGFECLVDDPGRLVRRLVAGGASLDGLEVSVLRLEEAFLRLTSEAET